MARKKREHENGQGDGGTYGKWEMGGKGHRICGAYFGPDGKRHWVSAKTKTECWRKLNMAVADMTGAYCRGRQPRYLTSRCFPPIA